MMSREDMLRKIARLLLERVASDSIGELLDPLNSQNSMTCTVCGKTSDEAAGEFVASSIAGCEWPTCNECVASIVDNFANETGRRTPLEEK